MKIVRANSNAIAVGGDVNLTINISEASTQYDLVYGILQALGLDADAQIRSLFVGHPTQTDEIVRSILMIAKSTLPESNDGYDAYFRQVGDLQRYTRLGSSSLKNGKYGEAHAAFKKALSVNLDDSIKPKLVYDYFVSGYVAASLVSDLNAIRACITELQSEYQAYFDETIDTCIAEAHQEIATRQIESDMLFENESILNRLLHIYGDSNVVVLNLCGLLYRRIGERKALGDRRLNYLEKALDTFNRLEEITKSHLTVEVRNNWAVALLRHFEATNNPRSLDEAIAVLAVVDYDARTVSLSDYLALPKTLNNRGNIFKRRMVELSDGSYLIAALDEYTKTERYWTEQNAPYEWAMIQKNKADARCMYMEIFGAKRDTVELALDEIIKSLKYRNAEAAPYQYNESMRVKNRLENLI
jgi:tetratricopeptide (TPR) repeat protein